MTPETFKERLFSGEPFKKGPITVDGNVDLDTRTSLTTLPDNLTVNGWLNLVGCSSLTSLGNNLIVNGALDLRKCISLTTLPDNLTVNGWLNLHNCTSLKSLPNNLSVKGMLDIRRCRSLQFNGSLGDINGTVYMDIVQMKQIPLEYLPLYIGYTYRDSKVLNCLKQRLKEGR